MKLIQLHNDPKADRIRASWLQVSADDAHWLAEVADETVIADADIGADRFGYIALDRGSAGLVVAPNATQAHIDCPTDMLIVPADRYDEAVRRIPALASAASPDQPSA